MHPIDRALLIFIVLVFVVSFLGVAVVYFGQ